MPAWVATTRVVLSTLRMIEATWRHFFVAIRRDGRWIEGIDCAPTGNRLRPDQHSTLVIHARGPVSDRPYRIVSVNLYVDETVWLDGLCARLKRRGLIKATRSEVVRLAITGLRRRLRGISDPELV